MLWLFPPLLDLATRYVGWFISVHQPKMAGICLCITRVTPSKKAVYIMAVSSGQSLNKSRSGSYNVRTFFYVYKVVAVKWWIVFTIKKLCFYQIKLKVIRKQSNKADLRVQTGTHKRNSTYNQRFS